MASQWSEMLEVPVCIVFIAVLYMGGYENSMSHSIHDLNQIITETHFKLLKWHLNILESLCLCVLRHTHCIASLIWDTHPLQRASFFVRISNLVISLSSELISLCKTITKNVHQWDDDKIYGLLAFKMHDIFSPILHLVCLLKCYVFLFSILNTDLWWRLSCAEGWAILAKRIGQTWICKLVYSYALATLCSVFASHLSLPSTPPRQLWKPHILL